MRPHSVVSPDGYSLVGFAPPEVVASHGFFSSMFYEWVLEFGLKRKDKELSQGLGADGKPLRTISAETKKHRISAMTPSGKGDPRAPALEPGWQKSRTRSLLTGRAFPDHVEFWWKYDSFTYASWARVLEHQAKQGRDVFGLSPAGIKWVQAQALKRWEAYKQGKVVEPVVKPFGGIPQVGEEVISVSPLRGMTTADWTKHFRAEARVAIPGRPKLPYNVLLKHIYGESGKTPPRAVPIPIVPPKPKPIVKVAMKPMTRITMKPIVKEATKHKPFVEAVQDAIEAVPVERLYGGNKAWIHDVWAAYVAITKDGISLAEFKARLVADPAFRAMMARADLVQAMNAADVAASQTELILSGKIPAATWNFLRRRKP